MQTTTQLRPHKVLGKNDSEGSLHALSLTTGPFSGIIFSYTEVAFEEDKDNDKLKIKFEYFVHDVPADKKGYDKKLFENELGDFLVELLYYGLERDHLGFIDGEQDRKDNPFQSDSQRGVLP
jgi:hypothetical protein